MPIDAFRRAGPDDAVAIAQLVNAAYRPPQGQAGWTHESALVAGARTSAREVAALTSRPDATLLVALAGARIAGCVLIEPDGRAARIGMLAVAPHWQDGGIGHALLAHAETHAVQAMGAATLRLLVLRERPELIGYYERRGYRRTGATMDYPRSADSGVPRMPGLRLAVLEKPAGSIAVDPA